MKQTAVEWLEERYKANGSYLTKSDINAAKEMERDQICKSYIYGSAYGIDISNNLSPDIYYKETFKSE